MSDQQQNSSSQTAAAPAQQAEVSPTVALFQKAHASLVTLQRIDEQISQLADRRRKTQAELREAQAQLNDEIARAAAVPEEVPIKFPAAATSRKARLGTDAAIAEAA